ncbi:hypothetical protein ACH4CE_33285 [Streptomyces gelaticus]|uniref:hypothetical protein n=1 Tax=Streptomyces gelaticus TaxID=285446 RepID=UPI0037969DFE
MSAPRPKKLTILRPWQGRTVAIFEDGERITAQSTDIPLGEILTVPTMAGSYLRASHPRRQHVGTPRAGEAARHAALHTGRRPGD